MSNTYWESVFNIGPTTDIAEPTLQQKINTEIDNILEIGSGYNDKDATHRKLIFRLAGLVSRIDDVNLRSEIYEELRYSVIPSSASKNTMKWFNTYTFNNT